MRSFTRHAGYSTCFRKEAGSHGRDTAGIFRVHQFEKIEQFCITSPNGNESWEMFEEMIQNSQDFYKENRCVDKSEGHDQSKPRKDEQQFVHMLNSTLTATERTICCILETYQREDGVEVPRALQPYMGGIDFLPFVQNL
nr:unnamed protein product [Digitaria exilis]